MGVWVKFAPDRGLIPTSPRRTASYLIRDVSWPSLSPLRRLHEFSLDGPQHDLPEETLFCASSHRHRAPPLWQRRKRCRRNLRTTTTSTLRRLLGELLVEAGYQCAGTPSICQVTQVCANAFSRPGESCGRRRHAHAMAVRQTCQVETATPASATARACAHTSCGDGLYRGREQCDDGNNTTTTAARALPGRAGYSCSERAKRLHAEQRATLPRPSAAVAAPMPTRQVALLTRSSRTRGLADATGGVGSFGTRGRPSAIDRSTRERDERSPPYHETVAAAPAPWSERGSDATKEAMPRCGAVS